MRLQKFGEYQQSGFYMEFTMKFLYTLAITAAVILSHSECMPPNFLGNLQQCVTNVTGTGETVPDSDIQLIKQRNLPTTHGGKCLLTCLLMATTMLTPDGTFNTTLPQDRRRPKHFEKLQQAMTNCSQQVTSSGLTDICEKGYLAAQCMKNSTQRLGQHPHHRRPRDIYTLSQTYNFNELE